MNGRRRKPDPPADVYAEQVRVPPRRQGRAAGADDARAGRPRQVPDFTGSVPPEIRLWRDGYDEGYDEASSE